MKKRIKKRMSTAQFKKKIMKLTGQKRAPSVKKKRKYTKRSPVWYQKAQDPKYVAPKYAYTLSFPIRGMQFYDGFNGKVGDELVLKPIDDNAFDPFAIAVLYRDYVGNEEQIGWFPRDTNPMTRERYAGTFQIALHRLLKQGKVYRATVQEHRIGSTVIVKLELGDGGES